jgi:hypothetical protein
VAQGLPYENCNTMKENARDSPAGSHFNTDGDDLVGRAHRARRGPHVSNRGREQPERNRASELVATCKLARPDAGCVSPSAQQSFELWYETPRQKQTLENLCKAIPATVWSRINADQDIAVEQVVGGNGGKGSFQFSCRKYLAEKTD